MTIYYRCPDKDYPVGGIRVIYRHVDLLNRNGFDAAVLHRLHPFRCTWFENETRVAHELRYPDRSPAARAWRAARRAQVDPLPASLPPEPPDSPLGKLAWKLRAKLWYLTKKRGVAKREERLTRRNLELSEQVFAMIREDEEFFLRL